MPSERPIAPSPSPRLGRTDTRDAAAHRFAQRGQRGSTRFAAIASMCGASLGVSAAIATSTLSIHQPRLRDAAGDLGEQRHRVGAAVLLVGRREQRAEIGQAGRPEERVGDRVRDRVAVGVTGEPRRVGDRDAAEHERRRVAERMHVETEADPVPHRVRRTLRSAPARARGRRASVSFRLRRSPSTTTTVPPAASTSAASSVSTPPVACAACERGAPERLRRLHRDEVVARAPSRSRGDRGRA